MEKINQDDLYELIKEEFTFLTKEYNFEGPYNDFDQTREYYSKIWYCAKNIAIEFSFDKRDQAISCYFSRLVDGKKPNGYLHNEKGEQIRFITTTWIRKKVGTPVKLFNNVKGLSLEERIRSYIKDYAEILKTYGRKILDDNIDLFYEQNPGETDLF